MIYSVNGHELNDAFNKNGVALDIAYDYQGNIVFSKSHNYDYTNFTITAASVGNQGQGIDVYGNKLFIYNPGSDTSDSRLRVYNLDTKKLVTNIIVDTKDHGNDITFSPEFYAESDEFPLLYISRIAYRIIHENGTWSAEKVKTLLMPNVYYQNMGMDFNGDVLIAVGYTKDYHTSSGNNIIVGRWDMTDLTDNGDGTYTVGLIDYHYGQYLRCVQGVAYHDGFIWVVCGLGGTNAIIYALDPDTAEIAYTIDSGKKGEPEGLAWAYNSTDGWYMLYWHKTGGNMRKVTFAH